MESFLQELSDTKKINLKMLIQLSKLLNLTSDVSQSRNVKKGKENADKTGLKNLEINVGTRALKILHHLTKTTLPLFAKERVTDELTLDCLCKCIFRVISCIEDNEHQMSMQPLEMEKAISNLINRCIEIKEYELALDLIHRVFERLSNDKLLVLKSSRSVSQKKADKSFGSREQPKGYIRARSEQWSAIIEKKSYRSLLFTVKKEIRSSAKVSVIITLMTNALRCWLEGTIRPDMQKMEEVLLSNHGCMAWCKRLCALDPAVGGKHSDFLYRILYKAAMTEADPVFQLYKRKWCLFYFKTSTLYKSEVLHDNILKFGLYFKKHHKHDTASTVLIQYYRGIIDDFDSPVEEFPPGSLKWIQSYLEMAKNSKSTKDISRGMALIGRFTVKDQDAEDNLESIVKMTSSRLAQIFSEEGPNFVSNLENIRACFNSMFTLVQMGEYDWNDEICRHYMQILNSMDCPATIIAEDLLQEMIEIMHLLSQTILIALSTHNPSDSCKYSNKLCKSILESSSSLVAKTASVAVHNWEKVYQIAQTVVEIANLIDFKDAYRWISAACFNVAGSLYPQSEFKHGLDFAKLSESQLSRYYSHQEDKTLDYALLLLIAKRYDLISIFCLALNDANQALEHSKRIISVIPSMEWDKLETNHMTGFYTKCIDRYVKTAALDSETYVFLKDLIAASLQRSTLFTIMQFELEVLQLAHSKSDTSILQSKAIDFMIELCQDDEQFFSRKISLQIAHGHCLRESGNLAKALKYFELALNLIDSLPIIDVPMKNSRIECLIHQGICMNELDCYTDVSFRKAMIAVDGLLQDLSLETSDRLLLEEHASKLSHLLDTLIRYLDVLNQPLGRIHASKLLIKLLRLYPKVAKQDFDLAYILSTIGSEYTHMGYTGQAGIAFEQVRALVAAKACNLNSIPEWEALYSQYLVSVGNIEKCQSILSDCSNNLSQKDDFRRQLSTVLSYQAKSFLASESGDLSQATRCAEVAFGILKKTLRVKRSRHCRAQVESWILSTLMNRCYSILGETYRRQGSVVESRFFLNQGLELSKSLHSQNFICSFELSLAELDHCCNHLSDSELWIKQAGLVKEQMRDHLSPREQSIYFIVNGDQRNRQNMTQESIEEYEKAHETLGLVMNRKYIDGLDVLGQSANKKLKSKGRIHNARGTRKECDSLQLDAKYKCAVLNNMKARISIRLGCIYKNLGDFKNARNQITLAHETDRLNKLEQTELCGAMADLRLQEIITSLKGSQNFELFQETVMVLPWGQKDEAKLKALKTKVKSSGEELSKRMDACEKLFNKYYELSLLFGSSQSVHDATHGLLYIRFLRYYFFAHGKEANLTQKLLNWACQFELGKGITSKRELKAILKGPSGADDSSKKKLLDLYQAEATLSGLSYRTEIIDLIPNNWTVCSLSLDPAKEVLFIVRQRSGDIPTICKLPLNRQFSRDGEETSFSYARVLKTWQDILNENDSTTHSGTECLTNLDKSSWWKNRKKLDGRMKELLESIEQTWLGGFKGILTMNDVQRPHSAEEEADFSRQLTDILSSSVAKSSLMKIKRLPLLDNNLYRMILELDAKSTDAELEDAVYFLLDQYQNRGIVVDYDELNMDSIVIDLRSLLEKICRSKDAEANRHLILILDKHLQMFPWESLPVLRRQSVSRMPNISFLRDSLISRQSQITLLNQESLSYVLNPSQDLKNTQKEFEDFLSSQKHWVGHVAHSPDEDTILKSLESKEIFLYFGHGGGEQYVRGQKIRELDACSTAILMGCSSGHLHSSGDFDPWGTPLSYLMGGSPCIVANLWDVTDKDIDRFSKSMLQSWGLSRPTSSGKSLPEAVSESRDACILKYLVGSAPVVYGIPVYLSPR